MSKISFIRHDSKSFAGYHNEGCTHIADCYDFRNTSINGEIMEKKTSRSPKFVRLLFIMLSLSETERPSYYRGRVAFRMDELSLESPGSCVRDVTKSRLS